MIDSAVKRSAMIACEDMATLFGYESHRECVTQSAGRVLDRFSVAFGVPLNMEDRVHRILLQREFLKDLCGHGLSEECSAALDAANKDEASIEQKLVLRKRVRKVVDPTESAHDDWFDPCTWNVSLLPSSCAESRALRLILFVEGLVDQETGILESGCTLMDGAYRITGGIANKRNPGLMLVPLSPKIRGQQLLHKPKAFLQRLRQRRST